MTEILSAEEWTRFFGVLCRDDGLDDIYNAEEKLQLHDLALRARLAEVAAERVEWHAAYESADDRAKVAVMRAEAAEARLAEVEQALRDVEPLIEWLAERAEDWAPEAEEAAQEGIARLRAVLDKGEQPNEAQ